MTQPKMSDCRKKNMKYNVFSQGLTAHHARIALAPSRTGGITYSTASLRNGLVERGEEVRTFFQGESGEVVICPRADCVRKDCVRAFLLSLRALLYYRSELTWGRPGGGAQKKTSGQGYRPLVTSLLRNTI